MNALLVVAGLFLFASVIVAEAVGWASRYVTFVWILRLPAIALGVLSVAAITGWLIWATLPDYAHGDVLRQIGNN